MGVLSKLGSAIGWLFMRPILLTSLLAALSILLNTMVMNRNAHATDGKYGQEQHESKDGDGYGKGESRDDDDHDGDHSHDQDGDIKEEKSDVDEQDDKQGTAQTDTDVGGEGKADNMQDAAGSGQSDAEAVSVETANQASQDLQENSAEVAKEKQDAMMEKLITSESAGDKAETSEAAEHNTAHSLLQQARKAFWDKDLDSAVELYQKLVGQTDDPAHKHELANVYARQGNAEQAVPLYTELAEWLGENNPAALQVIFDYVNKNAPEQTGTISQFLEKE